MFSSKWNFLVVGISATGALISALTHDGIFMVLNLFFTVVNWHLGNSKREMEDQILIEAYKDSLEGEDKSNE